jgi:LPS sulfotransferase NodH
LGSYFKDYCSAYGSSEYDGLSRYILATTSRVGGHFIGQILASTGMGQPHEFLSDYHLSTYLSKSADHKDSETIDNYWNSLFSETYREQGANGSFGIKLPFSFILPFIKHGNFPFGFKNWKWIYIYRRDVISQGISLYIAEKASSWNSFEGQEKINNLRIEDCDIDKVLNAIQIIINERYRWDLFFSLFGIPHLDIAYEDMLEDVLGETAKIRQFIGLKNHNLNFKNLDLLMKQEAPIYLELREKIINVTLGNLPIKTADLFEISEEKRQILELQSMLALMSAENAKLKNSLLKLGQE